MTNHKDLIARLRLGDGTSADHLLLLEAADALEALTAAPAQHPDDAAVDAFAEAMKAKMAAQRAKGYCGWDDKVDCPTERLQSMLVAHIPKGDPVDVGNFAMMLFNRGERTAAPGVPSLSTDAEIERHAKAANPTWWATEIHAYIEGAKWARGLIFSVAPAQPTHEQYLAVREGHFNAASDKYFEARPQLDSAVNRRIFYAGHCKGYDAHTPAQPDKRPTFSRDQALALLNDAALPLLRRLNQQFEALLDDATPAQPEPVNARLLEAVEALLSNEEHAVSCGLHSYAIGSQTWKLWENLRIAAEAEAKKGGA